MQQSVWDMEQSIICAADCMRYVAVYEMWSSLLDMQQSVWDIQQCVWDMEQSIRYAADCMRYVAVWDM